MLDGHSATLWQGAIYIWGGKDEQQATAQRSGVTYFSNAMFVIDPAAASEATNGTASLERITVATGASTAGQSHHVVPRGRAYHTASAYGKHLFIFGGLIDETDMAAGDASSLSSSSNVNLPVFDLERRMWTLKTTFGDVPCARCHHVAAVYGDTLFIHGGYPVISNTGKEVSVEEMASMQHAMYDVHELNLTSLRWRRLQNAQSPALWGHSCIVYNRNVIVFGGVDVVENAETGAVAVWHQDKKLWRWADFHDLDLRCAMHAAAVEGTRMLVYGGLSFRSRSKLRTLYEFNLEFGTWKELVPRGQVPAGRIGHAALAVQQQLFVIGGAIDGPAGSADIGLQAGRPERCLHIYSVPQNEWRTLQLVTTVGGGGEDSGMPGATGTDSAGAASKKKSETTWAVNATLDADNGGTEWSDTAAHVRDTISRAKAIQRLADNAATALQTGAGAGPGLGGYSNESPAGLTKTPAGAASSPFDDSRRRVATMSTSGMPSAGRDGFAHEVTHKGGAFSVPSQTEGNPAQIHLDRILELRGGASGSAEETRRVIDHLQSENTKLRKALEEHRAASLSGSTRNPYEVPIFNSASMTGGASATLPENDLPPSLRTTGGGGGGRLEGSRVIADFAPRLNINVAEPPRSLGQQSGFMSRSAVSALVNNVVARSGNGSSLPASVALGANLRAAQSLDPMSYLTPAPSVAAAMGALYGGSGNAATGGVLGFTLAGGTGSYQQTGAQSYDQLLSRSGLGNPSSSSAGPAAQMPMENIPISLQPLLSLLTGATPLQSNSFFQQQQQQQQQQRGGGGGHGDLTAPQRLDMSAVNASMQMQQQGMAGGLHGGPQDTSRRFQSPSLRSVVHGQVSMLSLGFLQRPT